MNREELIKYIKENDPFYQWVDFIGHSNEQLLKVKNEIDKLSILKDESIESKPK